MTARVVLVRHGQSEWNAQHRIQGQSGSGLTALGRRQADHTARWVAESHPGARLVSSDLRRCTETAAPIGAAIGVEPVLDPRLRERSFGRWEGCSLDEVRARDPQLWARWRAGRDVVEQVGGESGAQLATRVTLALDAHARDLDGAGTVVAVTHGGPVWHGLHVLLDLPWGTLGGVGNAAVTELVRDDGRWWCESWNQASHLPAAERTSFRPSETRTAASTG